MDDYQADIENELLSMVVNEWFRMPINFDEERELEANIYKIYMDSIHTQGELPSVHDIYAKIWMQGFGFLYSSAEDMVWAYAERNEIGDKIKFYDEDAKDFIAVVCASVSSYVEHGIGYKEDLIQYIQAYICKLGYSIIQTEIRPNVIDVLAGDAQTFMPYRFSWPCTVVGKNMLASTEIRKGGILIE